MNDIDENEPMPTSEREHLKEKKDVINDKHQNFYEKAIKDVDPETQDALRIVYLSKRIRNSRNFGFILLALASLGIIFGLLYQERESLSSNMNIVLDTRAYIIVFSGYFALLGFMLIYALPNRYSIELELLTAKQRLKAQLSNFKEDTYFSKLVEINVFNLAEYYTLIKVHTNNSFRASLYAGLGGFVFIASSLIIGLLSDDSTRFVAFISAGAGIITNFIAGVFFYLYNQSVQQLKGYHDSLLDVQNILLSFKIVGDVQDEGKKIEIANNMLNYLMENKRLTRESGSK